MIFIDCYGTLVERYDKGWRNKALITAIQAFRDKDPSHGICVWTWGTFQEAEEVSQRYFGTKDYAAVKVYEGYTVGDIIIDDHPEEWEAYANGARVLTAEQFITEAQS